MAAPTNNKNAAKPAEMRAESDLHIRVQRADKAAWVKTAQMKGQNLSRWVIDTLNRAT